MACQVEASLGAPVTVRQGTASLVSSRPGTSWRVLLRPVESWRSRLGSSRYWRGAECRGASAPGLAGRSRLVEADPGVARHVLLWRSRLVPAR